MTEVVVKGLERLGDLSVVTRATILASLSSLRPDLSH
ncbi:hypothetical protein Goshw_021824 [Gossypium schwendimanii]|uniref:Uncharacterized protein n=1 Tax=Gossypium schwendimanii TaxID=34291 RepID=A0A7J9MJM8_GOSSC|nr:hypothetical protein [Gossypium schwendimanii]